MPNPFRGDIIYIMEPWDLKAEDFPKEGSIEDKIKFVLGYAILAPSTHNSQPWLFKVEGGLCRVFYNKNLELPQADPSGRYLYISMGCMLENLVIAADYFGIFKDIRYILQDNLVAEVYFQEGGQPKTELDYLLRAIPKRVNARGLFENKDLPDNIKFRLESLGNRDNIKADFITDKKKIEKLASLTAEGLRIAYRSKNFRKEMSGWMHNNLTSKKTGMPGYSLRMPLVHSFLIPALVRLFDISPLLAKLNYNSMASVPFITILSSERSDPSVWLETGRLAEKYMLYLNSQGISTSIFIASVEMGKLVSQVKELLGTNLTPQFLFCAGYMKGSQAHSPREKLEKKLI
jgi:hypothetical protein